MHIQCIVQIEVEDELAVCGIAEDEVIGAIVGLTARDVNDLRFLGASSWARAHCSKENPSTIKCRDERSNHSVIYKSGYLAAVE